VVSSVPAARVTPAGVDDRREVRNQHDLRDGGSWTPWQRVKNDVIFCLAMIALGTARVLPLRALGALGRTVGAAAYLVARGARRVALANVARVYPEKDERAREDLVFRSFLTMGELLADAVALLRPRGGPLLALSQDAREVFDEARREGRGVVFASAHLGPWERVAASLVAAGVPLATIARESYDPRFTRLYEKLRGRRGLRVVWRSGRGATAGIVRTLRGGGVLGVPMDLRSRVPSCDAPFLGYAAPTPIGPARIALRTGAAVVVGTVAPSGGDGPLIITATRIPTSDLDFTTCGAARELTVRINAELSRRILAIPHAWVWMHERWTASANYDSYFS
jgi:KDO2-lipid IV(A) lauroyltransferase